MERSELEEQIERVADLIINSERIVVFTGAGVSTESGIPDFRSPGGIWSKYDPDDFTYQKFISSAETRKKHWKMFRETFSIEGAEPNPAHYAVAELEKMAKLDCVITQNVDSLHQKAGNTPEKVYELHGNVKWARCLSCDRRYPLEEVERRFEASGEAPDCEVCHGILKPDAVFFGETLPQGTLSEATWHSSHCDLFIVIGSTLVVYPAAFMPSYAVQSGAKLVIINLSSTPMDNQATVLIQGKAGEMMSRVMERVREKIKSS